MGYVMVEQSRLSQHDVLAIAEQVNVKLFETLGMDISTPEGRLEAQGAFRHMLFWYRSWGLVVKAGIPGTVMILLGWLVYKLTGWAGPPQ
jgi:hypothetical protein